MPKKYSLHWKSMYLIKNIYPGIDEETDYTEKLLVGYRWYDAKNETPLFPFGHGLSYTNFTYSNFAVSAVWISISQLEGIDIGKIDIGWEAPSQQGLVG